MSRYRIQQTTLQCPVCNRRVHIWRKKSKQRCIGHVKHMWCPYCQKKVGFVELKDLTEDGWMSLDGEVMI